jgi:lysophospholipid acyltransferase (LPLAT)-like uncharacterized protein
MAKKNRWIKDLSGRFAAFAMPMYASSANYRVHAFDPTCDPGVLDLHQRGVFIFWHEFIVSLLPYWGWSNLTLLMSQHRDAEWLNQTANRMGYRIVRGSTTRGGAAALKRLQTIQTTSSLVFTPDGPKGPRRQMAPGALYTANKLDLPIIPVAVGLSCAKRLKTWDRMAIPLPLTRVRVVFGERIWIPSIDTREELEAEIDRVSGTLNNLTDFAQQWADGKVYQEGYRPQHPRHRKKILKGHWRAAIDDQPSSE